MADFNISYAASELNGAINKANAAAPQSTTYTKTETNALLATKADASNIVTRTYLTEITLSFQANQYEIASNAIQIANLTNFDAIEISFKDLLDNVAKCETLPIDLLGSTNQFLSAMSVFVDDSTTQPPTIKPHYFIAAYIYKNSSDNNFYVKFTVTRHENTTQSQNVSLSLHGISGINQQ